MDLYQNLLNGRPNGVKNFFCPYPKSLDQHHSSKMF